MADIEVLDTLGVVLEVVFAVLDIDIDCGPGLEVHAVGLKAEFKGGGRLRVMYGLAYIAVLSAAGPHQIL